MKLLFVSALFAACFVQCNVVASAQLPKLKAKLGSAYAKTKGEMLIVGSGRMERTWILGEDGLSTIEVRDLVSGESWRNESGVCDWSVVGLTDGADEVQVVSLTAVESTDEGFTSEHLDVVAELLYPSTNTTVKYHIWVYPDAPGVRTQLYIKGDASLAQIPERIVGGRPSK